MNSKAEKVLQVKLLGEWNDKEKYGWVTRVEGWEAISRPFEYRLTLHTHCDSVEDEVFCNKKFAFAIQAPKQDESDPEVQRHCHGIIKSASFEKCRELTKPEKYAYHLTIVPQLYQTTQVRRTGIFFKENQTVTDVIEKILKEYSIEYKLDIKDQSLFIAESCLQYNETDFDLLTRLMSSAGFYYFFEHAEDKHTMVISNKATPYFDIDIEAKWIEETGNQKLGEGLKRLQAQYNSYNKEYEVKAFTYAKFDQLVEKTHSFTGHDKQEAPTVKSQKIIYLQQAEDVTEVQNITENFATYEVSIPECLKGESRYKSLAVGGKIKLKGKVLGEIFKSHKEYVITKLGFEVNDSTNLVSFENKFEAIPKDHLLLPIPLKKNFSGPHPAIVVNREGKDDPEEPVVDKKGQCYTYVKMLWGPDAWGADILCRALVVTSFDTTNIPKPGTFVNVGFLQNESYSDIPFILGAHTPKMSDLVDYEDEKHNVYNLYSAWHSDKEKDNFNSILFKDRKDEQEIELRAKKDMYSYITDMRQTYIGTDKKEEDAIDEKDDNDKEILVLKKGNRREVICEGNDTLLVNKGDILIKVKEGNYTLECKKKATIKAEDDVVVISSKTISLTADDKVVIEGKKGVEIISGMDFSATAKIGATMEGKATATVQGGTLAEVKAALVKVN
jgi:type VI secretion system secreted protein VgrG